MGWIMYVVNCLLRVCVLWALTNGAVFAASARIVVVFDSRTGNTERLARAAGDGARRVEGVEVVVKKTNEVLDEELLAADGILVGSPVHWSNISSEAKAFLDRLGGLLVSNKELGPESRSKLRTGGAFVTGGAISSGKELVRIGMIASLLSMRFVIVGGSDGEGFGTLGAQATTGEEEPALDEDELAEARRFGERFANVTLRLASP